MSVYRFVVPSDGAPQLASFANGAFFAALGFDNSLNGNGRYGRTASKTYGALPGTFPAAPVAAVNQNRCRAAPQTERSREMVPGGRRRPLPPAGQVPHAEGPRRRVRALPDPRRGRGRRLHRRPDPVAARPARGPQGAPEP